MLLTWTFVTNINHYLRVNRSIWLSLDPYWSLLSNGFNFSTTQFLLLKLWPKHFSSAGFPDCTWHLSIDFSLLSFSSIGWDMDPWYLDVWPGGYQAVRSPFCKLCRGWELPGSVTFPQFWCLLTSDLSMNMRVISCLLFWPWKLMFACASWQIWGGPLLNMLHHVQVKAAEFV